MKNNKNQVEELDYLKTNSKISWSDPELQKIEFWGLSLNEDGRILIDINKYKRACESVDIMDFIPDGLLNKDTTKLFIPQKKSKYDYIFNIFDNMLNEFARDWALEYKPIFEIIKTPKQIYDNTRLSNLAYTSNLDDLEDIEFMSLISSIKREKKYTHVCQSLYCQFISKLATETDRIMLIIMCKLGYKGNDYNFKSFTEFTDGLAGDRKGIKVKDLKKYNAYNMLHKINNFLKHNTVSAYLDLKKYYPDNVASIEKGTANIKYENGMFAGDWIIVKDKYIDELIKKLRIFFKEYCDKFVNESEDDAKWNHDDYFINAYNNLKNPYDYFGI